MQDIFLSSTFLGMTFVLAQFETSRITISISYRAL